MSEKKKRSNNSPKEEKATNEEKKYWRVVIEENENGIESEIDNPGGSPEKLLLIAGCIEGVKKGLLDQLERSQQMNVLSKILKNP